MGYEPTTYCDYCGEPFDVYRAPGERVCDGCAETNAKRDAFRPDPSITELRVVFDGPPSHESGRFVEVEDRNGRSVNAGLWMKRPDGYWELQIVAPFHTHEATDEFDDDTCGRCGHDLRHPVHYRRE